MDHTTEAPEALKAFLETLDLGQYFDAMAAEDLTLATLAELQEDDLRELGLSMGHRKTLLRALSEMALKPAEGSGTDERRQVTVFFCDLVGSTEIASRYDAEDMADILERYHKLTEEVILAHGGRSLGTQGDGVVACFGYPKAAENDAARAVAAALAISRAVPELAFADGLVLHSRIGLATGRVFVRGHMDISSALVGDTLNLASRLQDAAETDTVVVGANTRKLILKSADLAPMGARPLKGFEGHVDLWRVDGLRDVADLEIAPASELLGRAAELEQIRTAWSAAKDGAGRALVMTGEAGIGKSAVLDAARTLVLSDGAEVIRYFCAPGYENSALYPVRSEIARTAGLREVGPDTDVAGQLGTWIGTADPTTIRLLADLLGFDPGARIPLLEMTATEQKGATYQLLLGQIAAQAEAGPLMVLLEDAHWADPTTLEFVTQFLTQSLAALPILLIISNRPSVPLNFGALDHVDHVVLDRLGDHESRAIISRVMGNQVCPPDVMLRIVEASDGIPLFLEELTRSVTENQNRAAGPMVAASVPITLEDSLKARLDRLSNGKAVVQTAAVFGRRFPVEPLRQTLEMSPASFDTALVEPVQARILVNPSQTSGDAMLFRHALVQQAAYEGLARKERQQLHTKIASHFLENLPGLAETEPETLARHLAGGGQYEDAISYLILAGKKATARAAQVEATNHYLAALDLLQHLPEGRDRDAQEVLVSALLGGALMATRGFAAAEVYDAFARARSLCISLGDSPMYCACLYGLFTVEASRSNKDAAMDLAGEMMATFAEIPVPSWQIASHFANGVARFFAGEFTAAEDHFDKAIQLYTPDQHEPLVEQFGDNLAEFSMCYRQWLHLLRGEIDTSAQVLAKAKDMADALKNKNAQTRSIAFHMGHLMEIGAADEVAEIAPKVIQISTTQGYPYWACAGQIGLGWSMAEAGDQSGLAPILQSLGFFDMIGQRNPQTYWRMSLIAAHLALGQKDQALAAAATALEMSRAGLDCAFEAGILWRQGQAELVAPSDLAAAETCFRAGLEVATQQGATLYALFNALALAELLISQNRATEEGGKLAGLVKSIQSRTGFEALTRAKEVLKHL